MPTNPKLTSGEMSQIPNQDQTLIQSEAIDPRIILSLQLNNLREEISAIKQYEILLLDGAGNTTILKVNSDWFSKEDQKIELIDALVNSSKIKPLDYNLIKPLIFGQDQIMRLKEIIDAGCELSINPNCLNDPTLTPREKEQLTMIYDSIN